MLVDCVQAQEMSQSDARHVAVIEQAGGNFFVSTPGIDPRTGWRWIHFDDTSQLDSKVLDSVASLGKVYRLTFTGRSASNWVCGELSRVSQLRKLEFRDGPLNDDGVRELSKVEKLLTLWLDNVKVTGACLEDIAKLESLDMLSLENVSLGEADFGKISQMAVLRSLYLANVGISNRQIRGLLKCRGLERLEIYEAPLLTAEAIPDLIRLDWLDSLELQGTNVPHVTDGPIDAEWQRFKHKMLLALSKPQGDSSASTEGNPAKKPVHLQGAGKKSKARKCPRWKRGLAFFRCR